MMQQQSTPADATAAVPQSDRARDAGEMALWLLRERLLDEVDAALREVGRRVLLVKGAAIAHRYEQPWRRTMADIDALALEQDAPSIATTLRAAGLKQLPYEEGRRWSQHAFFEESFIAERAGALLLLELHTELDKMVARPIDYAAVFARARPRRPNSSLLWPADEDHALLLVLHAASSDFAHPAAWHDLALLWRAGLDTELLLRRARTWRLTTTLHLALRRLRREGVTLPDKLLRRTAPSRARMRLLRHLFETRTPSPDERRLGLPWVARQTPLRDDGLRWAAGVTRYAATRILDRLW